MELVSVCAIALGLMLCTIVTVFISWVVILARSHARYDHLPGPKRTSFFSGNWDIFCGVRVGREAFTLPLDNENKTESRLKPLAIQRMVELHEIYGDTYILFMYHQPWINTRSPNLIRGIYVEGDQRDMIKSDHVTPYQIFGIRFMYDGLVTTRDYHGWYLRRKVVSPKFHRAALRDTIDTINTTMDMFTDEMMEYANNGESFQLAQVLHRSTLDIILRSMLSMELNNLNTDFHYKGVEFISSSFQAIRLSMVPFYQFFPWTYSYRQRIRKQILEFREIGAKMIRERITLTQSEEEVPDDFLTDMVQNYLDPMGSYTMDIMVDEFVSLIVAGAETTVNAMSFCMMELGRNPELVIRLRAELDEVVGNKSYISNDDITKLPFITSLIKEILRLYPSVPQIVREVTKSTCIDGIHIPARATVSVNIFAVNRHPDYVEGHDNFDPDRFNVTLGNKVPMYSSLAFSVGPRNCIGQNLAMMEMKMMLVKFFQHFNLVLDKSECFEMGMKSTLFPLSELKCTVTNR